jgi:hypothetical protein
MRVYTPTHFTPHVFIDIFIYVFYKNKRKSIYIKKIFFFRLIIQLKEYMKKLYFSALLLCAYSMSSLQAQDVNTHANDNRQEVARQDSSWRSFFGNIMNNVHDALSRDPYGILDSDSSQSDYASEDNLLTDDDLSTNASDSERSDVEENVQDKNQNEDVLDSGTPSVEQKDENNSSVSEKNELVLYSNFHGNNDQVSNSHELVSTNEDISGVSHNQSKQQQSNFPWNNAEWRLNMVSSLIKTANSMPSPIKNAPEKYYRIYVTQEAFHALDNSSESIQSGQPCYKVLYKNASGEKVERAISPVSYSNLLQGNRQQVGNTYYPITVQPVPSIYQDEPKIEDITHLEADNTKYNMAKYIFAGTAGILAGVFVTKYIKEKLASYNNRK